MNCSSMVSGRKHLDLFRNATQFYNLLLGYEVYHNESLLCLFQLMFKFIIASDDPWMSLELRNLGLSTLFYASLLFRHFLSTTQFFSCWGRWRQGGEWGNTSCVRIKTVCLVVVHSGRWARNGREGVGLKGQSVCSKSTIINNDKSLSKMWSKY